MKFDDTRDFPYYNNNPRISKKSWIGLMLLVPISIFAYGILYPTSDLIGSIIFCSMLLIPLLYVSNWDYKLFLRKPTKNEVMLAVLMFVGYMVYAIALNTILETAGMTGTGIGDTLGITAESIVALIFSMMAEELIKFIPLMFFLKLFYRYTKKRKLSIVLSTLLVLLFFGLLHYNPPHTTLISVLLLQGLGSIFEVYGYLKTKNLFVPYLSHLLTDGIVFILIFIGLAA